MDISEWNDLLWELVRGEFYKPPAKLYLAFDESLLSEALNRRGVVCSSDGALSDFNRVIRKHCGRLRNGFMGLSIFPDGSPERDNWSWVFLKQAGGRSLCLTFVAHQILAAEMMHGVSFYAAYWEAFGIEPEENRINPFGDAGYYSFKRLWGRLKNELLTELSIPEESITFRYGSGSNKFRNLPISQSLLNERDLETLAVELKNVEKLEDKQIYARMTRVRLSPSGMRKVISGALKEQLVRQFRDFALGVDRSASTQAVQKDLSVPIGSDIDQLMLTEEQEIFGGSVVHCSTKVSTKDVAEVLDAHFQSQRCLVFHREDYYAKPSEKPVLPAAGEEVWIILKEQEVAPFLSLSPPRALDLKLSDYFTEADSSLPPRYRIVHCLSLPAQLACVEVTPTELIRGRESSDNQAVMTLIGGICVNASSSSYLCGFGPHTVRINGKTIDLAVGCTLDFEFMSLESALAIIAECSLPRMHLLEVMGVEKHVNFVEPMPRELDSTVFISCWSLVPSFYGNARLTESLTGLHSILDVFDSGLLERRERQVKRLIAELFVDDISWRKVDRDAAAKCGVILGYLELPQSLDRIIRDRITRASLAPASLVAVAQ